MAGVSDDYALKNILPVKIVSDINLCLRACIAEGNEPFVSDSPEVGIVGGIHFTVCQIIVLKVISVVDDAFKVVGDCLIFAGIQHRTDFVGIHAKLCSLFLCSVKKICISVQNNQIGNSA